jgi:hypothetical protein
MVDGVDPLQLEKLAGFMEHASGVPRDGYSVTLPPFATGNPDADNRNYSPDPTLLGLLNVRFILAEYDLPVEGLIPRERFGATRVYENAFTRPRAWMQAANGEDLAGYHPVEALAWTPNKISMTAAGPGTLNLSELAYPGWQVTVDGVRQELQVVDGILRGVRIERGAHNIVFEYRPYSLLAGLGLCLAALIFLVFQKLAQKSPFNRVATVG